MNKEKYFVVKESPNGTTMTKRKYAKKGLFQSHKAG